MVKNKETNNVVWLSDTGIMFKTTKMLAGEGYRNGN